MKPKYCNMNTNFNFNSAVCTSIEQSRKLLSLGLKKETADMHHWESEGKIYTYVGQMRDPNGIPAWSLHRLLSILDGNDCVVDITIEDGRYGIHCGYDTEWYDDLYDGIIAAFDELIKEGYFNKEYLEDGN